MMFSGHPKSKFWSATNEKRVQNIYMCKNDEYKDYL